MQLLDFIRRSIRTVWALRLLLMMRDAPCRVWSMGELVGELRASEAVVSGALSGFEQDGLVARTEGGGFRFAARGASLDELCDALAEAYRERPVAVINAITWPEDQTSSLADAFRFRDRPR